ncbi:hypothetical protein [Tenacibaculum halocynthiae]|uniref:hypothetical protein n=1 Tax=Tenacibaculum halocynthiae TaxID=1254437 RepID=UPI003892FC85
MKKSILKLGKVLKKAEQKEVKGKGMKISCLELGWNEDTCETGWNPEDATKASYFKCC